MGKILLKADISEINSENITSFNYDHVTRSELYDLFSDREKRNLFIAGNMTVWLQDCMNDSCNLSREECITIITNSEKLETSIVNRYKDLPIELLNEHASKLNLYYIENQRNIDPEFFKKHRENMDVNSFFSVRTELGDAFKFIDPELDTDYMRRVLRYSAPRTTIISNLISMYPEVNVAELQKAINTIYDHEITEQYLIEQYNAYPELRSHEPVDVARYYSSHNKPHYSNWEEFVIDARNQNSEAVAEVWFRDIISTRILQLVKDL